MFLFRGRTIPFWFGRLVAFRREGGMIAMLMTMLLIGLIGLMVGLIVGGFIGAQLTTLRIASDFWASS